MRGLERHPLLDAGARSVVANRVAIQGPPFSSKMLWSWSSSTSWRPLLSSMSIRGGLSPGEGIVAAVGNRTNLKEAVISAVPPTMLP
jgi:hypothetical protein